MSPASQPARPGLRRLSAVALCAVLLVACGADEKPESAPASPSASASPSAAPDVLLREAGAKTTAAATARWAVTATKSVGPQSVAFEGEGFYDFPNHNGAVAFDVPAADGLASAGRIEQRILGNDLFLALPAAPEIFYQLQVSDVVGTPLGASVDPTAGLQALVGTGVVDVVGTEEVRGVQTTRYQGTYDVRDALAQAQGPAKAILETALAGSQLVLVPFDAYLDSEGRLVKFQQRVELPASPETGGQLVVSTLRIELFEFGTPVVVAAPPPGVVRPGGPILDAIRESVPTVPPPAAPVPAPVS